MEEESNSPVVETTAPTTKEDHTMGMLCHLLALCGLVGIPMGNIVGPLVIWAIKRDESRFVDACGKEALNFQISMTIYTVIASLLILAVIGLALLPAIIILNVVLTIIASIKASEGSFFEYPLTLRFIK